MGFYICTVSTTEAKPARKKWRRRRKESSLRRRSESHWSGSLTPTTTACKTGIRFELKAAYVSVFRMSGEPLWNEEAMAEGAAGTTVTGAKNARPPTAAA